jgi:hypothetical protein
LLDALFGDGQGGVGGRLGAPFDCAEGRLRRARPRDGEARHRRAGRRVDANGVGGRVERVSRTPGK